MGCSPWGYKQSDTIEHTHTHIFGCIEVCYINFKKDSMKVFPIKFSCHGHKTKFRRYKKILTVVI